MPDTYVFTGKDGISRQFVGDRPPSPDEMTQIEKAEAPPVERGGLRHPLTSIIAPELDTVKQGIDATFPITHGQPVMARSRTGALYQSETGPGAKGIGNAIANGLLSGALGQVEGITSPIGIAASGLAAVPKAPLANAAASVLENVPAMKSVLPFANPAKQVIPFQKMAGALRTVAQTSKDADMGITRGSEMYQMERFPRSVESTARVPMMHGEPAPIAAATADAAPQTISAAERAQLVKQGYAPEVIAKIEQQAQGITPTTTGARLRTARPIEPMPSHAPMTGKSAKFAEIPDDPAMADILDRMAGGPDAPPVGNGLFPNPERPMASHPLTTPRTEVGAEAVGRSNGLTTQQVREATGPIRGEAAGEAAGMPSSPKDRIIAKLISMGPKGQGLPEAEREAYAAAGRDPKTRVQVQAYLDALRAAGLSVAGAAAGPSIREMLEQRMRRGVTGS
jgi:hypothetical protein